MNEFFEEVRKLHPSEAMLKDMETLEKAAEEDLMRRQLVALKQSELADAWDKGYKTAMFDNEYYSHNQNPYRSADERGRDAE